MRVGCWSLPLESCLCFFLFLRRKEDELNTPGMKFNEIFCLSRQAGLKIKSVALGTSTEHFTQRMFRFGGLKKCYSLCDERFPFKTPAIPAFWKWMPEGRGFKAIISYVGNLRPFWVTWDPFSKMKDQKHALLCDCVICNTPRKVPKAHWVTCKQYWRKIKPSYYIPKNLGYSCCVSTFSITVKTPWPRQLKKENTELSLEIGF